MNLYLYVYILFIISNRPKLKQELQHKGGREGMIVGYVTSFSHAKG